MLQRHGHLHIIVGEITRSATEATLKPVLVDLTDQGDDVALVEAQLAFVFWFEVIQGSTARLWKERDRKITIIL